MEHSEATETMASARYLLGELTEEERERFEEHFFGCSECARDVRDGSAMMDSIRAEKPAAGDRLKPVRTLPWFLTAAAAIGLVILGFQNAQLRRMAAPGVVPSYSMLAMGTRGAAQPTTIQDPAKPFALFVDIPPQPASPTYRIEIRDSSNRALVSLPVSAGEARETITVYVPPHRLSAGSYTVVIVGGAESVIGSAPLNVR